MEDVRFLYKYFPLRANFSNDLLYVKNVLEKNELKFSCLKDFNDPFDCSPIYIAPDEDFPYWIENLKGQYPMGMLHAAESNRHVVLNSQFTSSMKDGMDRAINNELGICCFSAKPDNLLMWAHYASFHKGVCFEFEATAKTPFFREAQRVYYKEERPIINILRKNPQNLENLANNLFLTKSDHWEYEAEYRIIGPARSPGIHKFPGQFLKGIIFGARIEPDHENAVMEIIKEDSSIISKRAVLNKNAYRIDIISLKDK